MPTVAQASGATCMYVAKQSHTGRSKAQPHVYLYIHLSVPMNLEVGTQSGG